MWDFFFGWYMMTLIILTNTGAYRRKDSQKKVAQLLGHFEVTRRLMAVTQIIKKTGDGAKSVYSLRSSLVSSRSQKMHIVDMASA